MPEKKKILIPGGKIDDCFLIDAAHKAGLYVISSGRDREAPGHKLSDLYVYADYADKEAILNIAREHKVDYICSCANDLGMLSTAYACEKLQLPGHDAYNTALTLHNKDRFKAFAERIDLKTPKAAAFTDEEAAIEYLSQTSTVKLIKPVDACSGMGISKVERGTDYRAAVKEAFSRSLSGRVVIEDFIEGQLHSASCFLVGQKVVFCFVEEGYGKLTNPYGVMAALSPAPDKENIKRQIIPEVEKVAEALKLVDGKIHMNMIVNEKGEAYIVEMSRRCSGDTYSKFVEFSTGIKWNEWIVKAEMGEDVSNFPRNVEQTGHHMFLVIIPPKEGVLKKIEIAEALSPHILGMYAMADPGKIVRDRRKDCLGLLELEYDSYIEMKELVKNYNNNIFVEVK